MPRIEWTRRKFYYVDRCNECKNEIPLLAKVGIVTYLNDLGIKESVKLLCEECVTKIHVHY